MRARRSLTSLALAALTTALVWGAPAAEAAAGCPKGEHWVSHEIAAGDTLSAIAVKYGTTMRSIERQNAGLDRNKLRAGKKLGFCVAGPEEAKPAAKGATAAKESAAKGGKCGKGGVIEAYTVQSGDMLGKIAGRYDVTEDAIVSQNSALKKNRNNLKVGQVLEICVDKKKQGTAKACGYNTPIFEHTVLPGDNVSEIAARYGVRRGDIYRLNPKIKGKDRSLQFGQKIRVCPDIAPRVIDKVVHTVAAGETLGSIAKTYGVTAGELMAFQNGRLKDANSLKVGQELVVYREGGIAPGFADEHDSDTGVLQGGVQLPGGSHYVVKHPSNAWGTSKTIRLIQGAVASYKRKVGGKGPKVHVGDISRKGGGKFPPHRSHQHGRDVDVGYVLTGDVADEKKFLSASKANLDAKKTWLLIKAFIDTDEVRYIFMDYKLQKLVYEAAQEMGESEALLTELFQYPRGKGRTRGIIRHWRRHVNHFHVRFHK
ncbi:MAG: penicillin-insensitive murein endopeptidase [Nannocystaceae bacterium]